VEVSTGTGVRSLWSCHVCVEIVLLLVIRSLPLTSSAADDISGETVAIKLVTRIFEKLQFAKRALREITLLRHFSHHSNITGLIDVDAISPDFSEMYVARLSRPSCLNIIIVIYLWRYEYL